MIYLSEAAIARVQKFMRQQPDAIGIQVKVTRSGCSGYSYHIDMAKGLKEGQLAYPYEGFQVIVDNDDLPLVEGLRLDVKKQGLNEAFSFENPKAQATCGCGTSFSF
ncbi:HesB/IscA family protein [Suttonella ornithocola]|uniref:Iron-sulfur cluster assembly protein n=1 Tax=Suttonella ornithocola TaxID=279832 RepID=A0A380MTB2_9GAMM|nr:iron-sulfur cluster assembly accessory protein [Suttonella ornithocola]SUO95518.1 Iron-sulfur cluster assembly protein [Suttonella ornithocola]